MAAVPARIRFFHRFFAALWAKLSQCLLTVQICCKIHINEFGGLLAVENAYCEFALLYDRLMRDVDYDAWTAYVMALADAFLQREGAAEPTAIDCACGTGEVTLRLARSGLAAVGVDRSADMLRVAQQKAMTRGLRIPFVQADMRGFTTHHPVDLVLACCDGVNYLDSQKETGRFFAAANRALKPGGLLLFDISSAYQLEHVLDGRTFGESEEDYAYLWQNVFDAQTRLLEMNLTFFVRDGARYRRFDETHIQRAHTDGELDAELIRQGFAVCGKYEAFTKNPPQADSERIQWVARKLTEPDRTF